MSVRDHRDRAVPEPEPAAEIEVPWCATRLDVDVAELTVEDVIVLVLIVPRRPSEAGERTPAGVDRHRPAVTSSRERRPSQRPPATRSDLTERERAVARLAGRALTNQQIANRLGISPHTVNFHLRQIFRKLGIDSRVQLARLRFDQSHNKP